MGEAGAVSSICFGMTRMRTWGSVFQSSLTPHNAYTILVLCPQSGKCKVISLTVD